MAKVYLTSLADKGYSDAISQGLDWLNLSAFLKPGDRVLIKPNLTFPFFRPGVMTNPEALESLIIYLRNFTSNITICESDTGGYNQFSMDEVFERIGISSFARRYGIRVTNVSHEAAHAIHFHYRLRKFSVPLPRLLVDETDLFITIPVPKVHSNTVVSLAIKNQWGLIQDQKLRLKLHPYFKRVVYEINKALPKTIVLLDGKYGLNRIGPTHPRGEVVQPGWILMSDSVFYADYVTTDLMGFDYRKIPYLKYIFHIEGINSLDKVEFNTEYVKFKKIRFYLKRHWTDYPGLLCFNSGLLAYIGYESVLAGPLHWLLYRFREPFYDKKYGHRY
jgi:uncharacterized protein (DUF362 family)